MDLGLFNSLVTVEMLQQFETTIAFELILAQDEFRARSRFTSIQRVDAISQKKKAIDKTTYNRLHSKNNFN